LLDERCPSLLLPDTYGLRSAQYPRFPPTPSFVTRRSFQIGSFSFSCPPHDFSTPVCAELPSFFSCFVQPASARQSLLTEQINFPTCPVFAPQLQPIFPRSNRHVENVSSVVASPSSSRNHTEHIGLRRLEPMRGLFSLFQFLPGDLFFKNPRGSVLLMRFNFHNRLSPASLASSFSSHRPSSSLVFLGWPLHQDNALSFTPMGRSVVMQLRATPLAFPRPSCMSPCPFFREEVHLFQQFF